MIRINQIKIAITQEQDIELKIREKLKIGKHVEIAFQVHRRTVDARKKEMLYFVYSVDVKLDKKREKQILVRNDKNISKVEQKYSHYLQRGTTFLKHRPIVVGFGPAGMFAAYVLAKHGYCPIVLERGEDVDARTQSVDTFFTKGILNENSNIQFGEGGAGTFSDGKLTARSKDSRVQLIYDTLVKFGAPKEILFEAIPHIGSDRLKGVVKNIRKEIIRLGGEVRFNSKMTSLLIEDDKIIGVCCKEEKILSEHVILALGHSARDTIVQLHEQGIAMEAKDFAIGLRIEHKQKMINEALYHDFASHPSLASASYFLSNQKGCYTFCMCPGGSVVAATSLKEHVVVNGMSDYAQDKENANSAVLVKVDKSVYGTCLFDGMKYLDELEQKAFLLGGKTYQAPAQLVRDFIENKSSTHLGSVKPSYPLGVKLCNLRTLLPDEIVEPLVDGLLDFNTKLKGFAQADALLTAIETRTSSPIRMIRDSSTLQANMLGLYPCGEGAGYAGGITSSAIDGVKCAEMIIKNYVYDNN